MVNVEQLRTLLIKVAGQGETTISKTELYHMLNVDRYCEKLEKTIKKQWLKLANELPLFKQKKLIIHELRNDILLLSCPIKVHAIT